MRKMKKLAALCLAMLMAFSIMAVTAAAYDAADGHEHTSACSEQTIMPRRPAVQCVYCRQEMAVSHSESKDGGIYFTFICRNLDCAYKDKYTFGPVFWKP